MKKNHYIYQVLSLFAFCALVGCANHKEVRFETPQNETKEAEQRALEVFCKLAKRQVSSALRSSDIEKLGESDVYISNFAGGGFLLYGVDPTEEVHVYGFSDSGKLNSSDTIATPILKTVLDNSIAIQNNTNIIINDSLGLIGGGGYNPTYPPLEPVEYPIRIVRRIEHEAIYPYSPSTLPYGQKSPFNDYVNYKNLGCANTALAVFLSHYRVPNKVTVGANVTPIDWTKLWSGNSYELNGWRSSLTEDLAHQVAEMCKYIFFSNPRVWIIPEDEGTAVFPKRVREFLEKINFEVDYRTYKENELLSYLRKNNRPVLMYGEASFFNRHYWVIDGYLEFHVDNEHKVKWSEESDWEIERYEKDVEITRLVHCNWGWNAYCNGYFFSTIFDSERGTYPDSDYHPMSSNKGGDYRKNAKAFYVNPDGRQLLMEWYMEK